MIMIKMMMMMTMKGMHNGDENMSDPPADFEGPSSFQLFATTEGIPGSHTPHVRRRPN